MLRRLAVLAVAPALLIAAPAHADTPTPTAPPTAAPSPAAPSPAAPPPATPPPATPPAVDVEPTTPPATLMSEVVAMTNQQRTANGCNALAVDRELTWASVRQSRYMATTGRFTHVWADGTTFVARAHAAGYEAPSGENIAWGYDNAAEVMAAWMASPHHRRNILNCDARSIGTGVVYATTGIPYYTEVLGYE